MAAKHQQALRDPALRRRFATGELGRISVETAERNVEAHGSRPARALAVLAEGTRGCGRRAERPARCPESAGTPRAALAPSRWGEAALPADSLQHLPLSFLSERGAGQPSTRRRL